MKRNIHVNVWWIRYRKYTNWCKQLSIYFETIEILVFLSWANDQDLFWACITLHCCWKKNCSFMNHCWWEFSKDREDHLCHDVLELEKDLFLYFSKRLRMLSIFFDIINTFMNYCLMIMNLIVTHLYCTQRQKYWNSTNICRKPDGMLFSISWIDLVSCLIVVVVK